MRLALRLLKVMVPSFTARRVAHLDLTKTRVVNRMKMRTDRKDIMINASLCPIFRVQRPILMKKLSDPSTQR